MDQGKQFVKAIYDKKPEAWEQLYMRYYDSLCHYALKILKDAEQATDMVQETLIRLWEKPVLFDNESLLGLYLYRAVNNNCLQYIRNKNREDKRLQEWLFFTDTEEDAYASLNGMVMEEVYRKLNELIATMPPKRKEVILLSMKQMSNEEIADAMQITVHAVKKHKKEAYAYLRDELGGNFTLLFVLWTNPCHKSLVDRCL